MEINHPTPKPEFDVSNQTALGCRRKCTEHTTNKFATVRLTKRPHLQYHLPFSARRAAQHYVSGSWVFPTYARN
jgi:hypothetical protein